MEWVYHKSVRTAPPWYDDACTGTSLVIVVLGVLLLAKRDVGFMAGVLVFAGVASVVHRAWRRCTGEAHPLLFALDLAAAAALSVFLNRRVSCTSDGCVRLLALATSGLMAASWLTTSGATHSYASHTASHVVACVLVARLVFLA